MTPRPPRRIRQQSLAGARPPEAHPTGEKARAKEVATPGAVRSHDARSRQKSRSPTRPPVPVARNLRCSAARRAFVFRNEAPLEIRRPSRGFLIHSFARNFGIIGTLLHYRKEPNWPFLRARAGKSSGFSRTSVYRAPAKVISRGRSSVRRVAPWWVQAKPGVTTAARTFDSAWLRPAARLAG